MNSHLQRIHDLIKQSAFISAEDKSVLEKAIKDTEKELEILSFKLDRTEKVKRTTAILLEETIQELEQKRKAVELQNREFEIETSLERVRSVAMGMQQPADMLDVCRIISDQLQLLHVAEIRNVQTAIIDGGKGTYINYQYFTPYQHVTIEEVEYNKHPKVLELVLQLQQSADAFFSGTFVGEELEVWRQYRKDDNQFPDPILDEVTAVFYYFYSIGHGGLGISTYAPLSEEAIHIFKRFRNVFDLAYRRFIDIQKAEAQAREAQIEVAVERVRAKALAMHKSEDLHSVVVTLKKELMGLRIPNITAATMYLAQNDGSIRILDLSDTGGEDDDKPQLQLDKIFRLEETDPDLWIRRMWNRSENYFVLEADEADFVRVVQWIRTVDPAGAEIAEKIIKEKSIKKAWLPTVKLEKGRLNIDLLEPPTDEIKPILLKMGAGFDLAYRRFLDLQKAEAQAREAQIEASLERVRAKAMAMHKSEDLNMAVATVFEELDKLDLGMARCGISIMDKEKRSADVFTTSISDQGKIVNVSGDESIDIHPLLQGAFDAWVKQSDFSYVLEGKDLARYYQAVGETNIRLPDSQIILSQAEEIKQYFYIATFQAGCLFAFRDASFSEEAKKVMKRFADVFNLTYTRFLDLQKAEAQAREAQIEVSLERVRSKTLAMHSSEDLSSTVNLFFKELKSLGITPMRCGVGEMHEETRTSDLVFTTADKQGELYELPGKLKHEGHPVIENIYNHWKMQEEYHPVLQGADINAYYKVIKSQMTLPDFPEYTMHYGNYFYFREGFFFAWAENELSEEGLRISRKFTSVLSLTYKRYKDLKQAEAQAREAQIEASLERVRSKAMAMQKSEDLANAVAIVFEELDKLKLGMSRCGIGIMDKEKRSGEVWTTTVADHGTTLQVSGHEYMDLHPLLHGDFEAWLDQRDFSYTLKGQDLVDYYKVVGSTNFKLPESQIILSNSEVKEQYYYATPFGSGALFAFRETAFTDEAKTVMGRFADVFNLTYTRYNDLKQAELQTHNAQIEVALERVRARALAMQVPEELIEVAEVLRHEMGLLGVEELETSTIFIHDESSDKAECWFAIKDTKQTEKQLVSDHITLGLNDTWVGREMIRFYESEEKQISIPMQGFNRSEWIEYCYKLSSVFDGFYGDHIPDRTYHLYKFSNGAIGAASPADLSEESWELLSRAASVFSLAYSRFKDLTQSRIDLQRLKEEKKRAEEALNELKSTQTQLIHAEKMASLGELTAGISHEIQNPLNFVNNFSEVNTELIEEMKQEIANENLDEVIAIANDIKDNQEKITHHGKRADAIVKGMLQHSRTSSGQKEPTDINALADEYLRLAYHGLRAKDKSFNAIMKTDFDESIGLINIIPQDIGRVILNLITNAFYAVTEKKNVLANTPYPLKGGIAFEPTVSVSTKKIAPLSGGRGSEGETIQISVKDNGNGIPQNILDKIFQPFYTTKPTGKGTGLGLSLSYDIIKAHGGDITVETKIDQGTIFIISLPL